MAAPYNPPVKNEDFVFYITLEDYTNPGNWKTNPTLAAGDFKVSKDNGALTNLDTTPDVDPDAGIWVKVTLTATEMNADNVKISGQDQTSPKEWSDFAICILTTSA